MDDLLADEDDESDVDVAIVQFDSDSEEVNDSGDESGLRDGGPDAEEDTSGDGWSKETSDVAVNQFVEDCGPVHGLGKDAEPLDYFSLIIPEDFYELAARETNDYAQWRQETAKKADKVWYNTTPTEIKLYIHINIIMGIHRLSEYTMYWSSDDRLRVPGIADVMGKTRYEKLSQYFHLNNSRTHPPRGHEDFDPLYKIRPLIDIVQTNIDSVFQPGKNICFNEAMITYHGQLAFKQHIKGKPNPWGIKVWCAADSLTGYLLKFFIYTGKVNNPMSHSLGHHVIASLGETYLGKNHHFFYDKYFSSVQLASDLLRQQTYCCSTVQSNRAGLPKDCTLKSASKMNKGEIRFRQRGNMVALAWKDKQFVTMLATNTSPGVTTVQRHSPTGLMNIEVPSLVDVYNRYMGGVDRFDQLSSYYPVGRKSRKWWRYVFCFLLQTALINSWIIYSSSHRSQPKAKQMSQIDFHLSLCTALVKGNTNRKRRGSVVHPVTAGVGNADLQEHKLIRKAGCKRACYWCSKSKNYGSRGRAHETVYGCNLCQIRLCRGGCFSQYHNSLKQ